MSCVRSSRGFTLIELLVVIAIIGMLSSVVLASLNTARYKAADARRVSDLKSVQTALELYYSSNNSYPDTASAWRSRCSSWGSYAQDDVIPGLAPTHIAQVPVDPNSDNGGDCCYLYNSNGQDYKFMAHSCSKSNYNTNRGLIDPPRDGPNGPYNWGAPTCSVDSSSGGWSWAVYTYGATCI